MTHSTLFRAVLVPRRQRRTNHPRNLTIVEGPPREKWEDALADARRMQGEGKPAKSVMIHKSLPNQPGAWFLDQILK